MTAGCLDLASWGVLGQVLTAVLAGLAVLRPISQVLLAASNLLSPRVALLARCLYALGQLAGMICISKPAFATRFKPPGKPYH